MIFEVEFTNKVNDVLFTALIYADTVTKCREQAKELLREKRCSQKAYHIYIEEAI
ncbi:hypothetical protein Bbad01_07870 [Bacillus badius]|nr:hypothetical protein Bbad01_07870 [Bacillus badius]